jgi:hypothetical protein
LHEVLHVLGFVAQCAPNHTLAGHTSDGPEDLMYAGNQPWRPAVLDTNRDDYYGTGSSVCPDLADSAFLDPSPTNPVLPSGWPYINAHEATIPCASEATVVPGAPGAFSRMTVVHNYFSGNGALPLNIWELQDQFNNGNYTRAFVGTVSHLNALVFTAQANSIFVATLNGTCVAMAPAGERWTRFVIRN